MGPNPRRIAANWRATFVLALLPGLALVTTTTRAAGAGAECSRTFYIAMIDSLPIQPNFDDMGAVSLRVDASGRPQVAHKLWFGPVRLATLGASGWHAETAYASDDRNCELMLDATGSPHILFHLGILRRNGTTWTLNPHTLYFLEHVGGVMAADGAAHVVVLQSFSGGSYIGVPSHVLVQGSTWAETPLEPRNDSFTSPNASVSVRLDSNGVPRFCLTNTLVAEVRYWEWPETAEKPAIPHARWGSLAIDAQGITHVAYYDLESHDLGLATFQNGSWSTTPVDTDGDVGAWASLDIDAQGGEHIAYYDNDSDDLEYAYRAFGESTWARCTVDANGDVGSWASLDVDSELHVHIAYWDATTRHVKYSTTRAPLATRPASWTRMKSAFR